MTPLMHNMGLMADVEEWRQRAVSAEVRADSLERENAELRRQLAGCRECLRDTATESERKLAADRDRLQAAVHELEEMVSDTESRANENACLLHHTRHQNDEFRRIAREYLAAFERVAAGEPARREGGAA